MSRACSTCSPLSDTDPSPCMAWCGIRTTSSAQARTSGDLRRCPGDHRGSCLHRHRRGAVPGRQRQNEAAALGFVGVRVLEANTIFLCVVSLLSVVTLRQAAGVRGRTKISSLIHYFGS